LTSGESDQADVGWSADGNRLVFGDMHAADPDNSVIRVLDLKTHQTSELPGSKGLFSPHWSPDGRYIAAIPASDLGLILFDFTTQKWTELTKVLMGYPSWSRDSKYIYFDTGGNDPGFHRVRIADLHVSPLSRRKGFS